MKLKNAKPIKLKKVKPKIEPKLKCTFELIRMKIVKKFALF